MRQLIYLLLFTIVSMFLLSSTKDDSRLIWGLPDINFKVEPNDRIVLSPVLWHGEGDYTIEFYQKELAQLAMFLNTNSSYNFIINIHTGKESNRAFDKHLTIYQADKLNNYLLEKVSVTNWKILAKGSEELLLKDDCYRRVEDKYLLKKLNSRFEIICSE